MWMLLACAPTLETVVENKEHQQLPRDTSQRLVGRLGALGVRATAEIAGRTVIVHTTTPIEDAWLAPGGMAVTEVDEERSRTLVGATPEEMRAAAPDLEVRRIVFDDGRWWVLGKPVLSFDDVVGADAVAGRVDVRLTPAGRARLAASARPGEYLAMFVGPALRSVPRVVSPLDTDRITVDAPEPRLTAAEIAWPLPSGLQIRSTPAPPSR